MEEAFEEEDMMVRPIRPGEYERVAAWLAEERNNRWLDFGGGRRVVDAAALKVMCQRDLHRILVYTEDETARPIGIVGLSDVDRRARTATLWFVLGEKEFGSRGFTSRAADRLLRTGFEEMELRSVFAWTVEVNRGGRGVLERLGFRFIGRKRRCHSIEGELHDRLLYDLLAEEYREDSDRGAERAAVTADREGGEADPEPRNAEPEGGEPRQERERGESEDRATPEDSAPQGVS